MSTEKSRKPDYKVKAMHKLTNYKGAIGAAWKNDDGTISLVLDPFIVISSQADLIITLFPPEYKPGV